MLFLCCFYVSPRYSYECPHGVSHHQAMDVSEDAMQDVRTTWTDDGQGCLERPGIGDIWGYPSYLKIENDCLVVTGTMEFYDFPYILEIIIPTVGQLTNSYFSEG